MTLQIYSASFFMFTAATALRVCPRVPVAKRGGAACVSLSPLVTEGCASIPVGAAAPFFFFPPFLVTAPSRAGFFSLGCVGWTCAETTTSRFLEAPFVFDCAGAAAGIDACRKFVSANTGLAL